MAAIKLACIVLASTLVLLALAVQAGVLPEDRADALYHSYSGGGVEVTGPSVLLRKGDAANVSVSGNFYVDSITSASIDVLTQGSPYAEKRTQNSVGVDFLHANTVMSVGYTASRESDYNADTASFSISQNLFGDLTTVSMGYVWGNDVVSRNGDAVFSEHVERQHYQLGLAQILSKDLLLSMDFEAITEQGFLNNPYRSIRYVDNTSPLGYSYQAEVYPNTRTSGALATQLKYYLPYRAALGLSYRYFADNWNISAHTVDLSYVHPVGDHWLFDVSYRFYDQTQADFYSDLFASKDAQNFLARDKELSAFNNHSIGVGISYELLNEQWKLLDKASISAHYHRYMFDYDNYRDLTNAGPVGLEPLYELDADVVQFYMSVWY